MSTPHRQQLLWFDPGCQSHAGAPAGNLGNLVIQRSLRTTLESWLPGWQLQSVSTFEPPTPSQIQQSWQCPMVLAGGANLLTSHMRRYRQWVISLKQAWKIRPCVLAGVGWWNYQDHPDLFTRFFLKRLLCHSALHSVRDSYTEKKLRVLGFQVINTGCPTLWSLPAELPRRKASRPSKVLWTITDYARDPVRDHHVLQELRQHYDEVYFWPQGLFDEAYVEETGWQGFQRIDRSLEALDEFLDRHPDCEYVGTRLHGGIACLQRGIRSLILEVDNRAREMGRDFALPTLPREDPASLTRWIEGQEPGPWKPPTLVMNQWKAWLLKTLRVEENKS